MRRHVAVLVVDIAIMHVCSALLWKKYAMHVTVF